MFFFNFGQKMGRGVSAKAKKSFARMTEENFDDYNDGCKDNYDNNYGDIIIW